MKYQRFPGAAGTVGFISAMSNHFCANCNRLRLTADGNVRPCLFSDAEYSVREALRRGDDMQVLSIWRDAVAHKPQEHAIMRVHNDLCPKSEDDHMAKSRYADATKAARRAAMSAHKATMRLMLAMPLQVRSRLPALPPSPPATPVATS